MSDFTPLYAKLLAPIFDSIFKESYLGGIFTVNTPAHLARTVQNLIGERVHFSQRHLNNNFPQLPLMWINLDHPNLPVRGIAVGRYKKATNDELLSRAFGEFLERFSSLVPIDTSRKFLWNRDGTLRVLPKTLAVKKVFGYGNKELPIEQIYYGLRQNIPENPTQNEPTSNGGAGFFDRTQATLGGLLELIERDAFFVHWLTAYSPQHIYIPLTETSPTTDTVMGRLYELLHDFKKYHIEYHFLDITTDIAVPTVCCVLTVDSPTGKRLACGTRAGFNGPEILLASAAEALGILGGTYFEEPMVFPSGYPSSGSVKIGSKERFRLYTTDSMYEHARFLTKESHSITLTDWVATQKDLPQSTRTRMKYLGNIFSKRAEKDSRYEVFVYHIQNVLTRHFGYHVARVFCEGLYPLYLDERYKNTKHPRITEFLNHKKLPLDHPIHLWPHPFC